MIKTTLGPPSPGALRSRMQNSRYRRRPGPVTLTSWKPFMEPCITCHCPPPANRGGGASATAFTVAMMSAATPVGHRSRNSRAGTVRAESSSRWRWKKWMRHGELGPSVGRFLGEGFARLGVTRPARQPCEIGSRPGAQAQS